MPITSVLLQLRFLLVSATQGSRTPLPPAFHHHLTAYLHRCIWLFSPFFFFFFLNPFSDPLTLLAAMNQLSPFTILIPFKKNLCYVVGTIAWLRFKGIFPPCPLEWMESSLTLEDKKFALTGVPGSPAFPDGPGSPCLPWRCAANRTKWEKVQRGKKRQKEKLPESHFASPYNFPEPDGTKKEKRWKVTHRLPSWSGKSISAWRSHKTLQELGERKNKVCFIKREKVKSYIIRRRGDVWAPLSHPDWETQHAGKTWTGLFIRTRTIEAFPRLGEGPVPESLGQTLPLKEGFCQRKKKKEIIKMQRC